ncbi:Protein CotJB (modular protein) [[Clostridium] ultunense Esp]|nr:Protein CotJB (modular protein) [[Clostridium] ultunense Esp]
MSEEQKKKKEQHRYGDPLSAGEEKSHFGSDEKQAKNSPYEDFAVSEREELHETDHGLLNHPYGAYPPNAENLGGGDAGLPHTDHVYWAHPYLHPMDHLYWAHPYLPHTDHLYWAHPYLPHTDHPPYGKKKPPVSDIGKGEPKGDDDHLLHELQAIDFVLMDLTLYLDTHPADGAAISQYNALTLQRKKIKEDVEARFGPLSGAGHSFSGYPWSYSQTPWPWQV